MRKTYIDNIKWITVLIVCVYHVIYMYNSVATAGVIGPLGDGVQYQDAFQYFIYPWFMLLLFTVSGMNARTSLEKHSHREFIRIRTRRYLVPSTIGLFVWGWMTGYFNMAVSGAFDQMNALPKPVLFLIMAVSGTSVLWYIQLLWVFSLLLVLFRKAEKDRLSEFCKKAGVPLLIALTVVIWGSAQILNTPIIVVYRFGIYFAGFMIGYLFLSHDEVMDRLEKQWLPLTAAAVILCGVFTFMYWGMNYAEHEVLDTLMCNIYAWTGTLAVLSFMKKWGGFENAFSRWMTKKSWGIYVFHYLPLVASAWLLHTYCPQLSPVIVYILTGTACIGGALAIYEIFSRIPFVRWAALGMGGKK